MRDKLFRLSSYSHLHVHMVTTRGMRRAVDVPPPSESDPTATHAVVTVAKPMVNQKQHGRRRKEMPPPEIINPLPVGLVVEEPSEPQVVSSVPALVSPILAPISPILASAADPPIVRKTRKPRTKAKAIEADQTEQIGIPEYTFAVANARIIQEMPKAPSSPATLGAVNPKEVINVKHENKKLQVAAKVSAVIPDSDYAMMSELEDLSSDESEITGALGTDDAPALVQEEAVEDYIIDFEVETDDVVKLLRLPISMSWWTFQDQIAETMGCHETRLRLGYRLSTARAGEKAHSLETLDEYSEMQQEIVSECEKQVVLQKKASKMKPPKALKVLIKDRRNKAEKKTIAKPKTASKTSCAKLNNSADPDLVESTSATAHFVGNFHRIALCNPLSSS
ncbi:uncharacterized protein EI90DRAFT_3017978 [Cantharellus anzutake]|uniref:uncharacterized protein n=1 Tax=Cantharellus anzutake TaxID=1750568 RepID=UPI001908A465|nr:uncharacterized protein EI90DRAFT_3017978 [Cantharellus anzutake]KAF8327726.1 hypothetical protein EI90DRAFT_3017978 [Cantharellus anzutake]